MTTGEPRAPAVEALVSELYGALDVAKLTVDVGTMHVEVGSAVLHRKGSVPLALKGLAMPSTLWSSRELARTHDGALYCEACGHEGPRAPAPATRPTA